MTMRYVVPRILLLLVGCVVLSGCSAGLALLIGSQWDEWFDDDDPANYRVYLDGYDIGSIANANGNLTIRGVSEGDYLITVAKPPAMRRGLHAMFHIKSGVSVSLRDTNPFEGGVITGTVRRDSATGPVLPNVRVVALKNAATLLAGGSSPIAISQPAGTSIEYMMGYTDSSGDYRLGPAEYGEWLVTAAVAGYESDVRHVSVSSGVDGSASLTLIANPSANPGLVRGSVTSHAGKALSEPLITAKLGTAFAPNITDAARTQVEGSAQVTMPSGPWFEWGTLTDIGTAGGEYMVDLPAGTHTIEAFKLTWRVEPADVTVSAGGVATVNFSLAKAG